MLKKQPTLESLQRTVTVGGSLVGGFVVIASTVGGWWLSYNFERFDTMYDEFIRLQSSDNYQNERFAAHTGDTRNHPDNTSRVTILERSFERMEENQSNYISMHSDLTSQVNQILVLLSERE